MNASDRMWWLCVVLMFGMFAVVGWFLSQPASLVRAMAAVSSIAVYGMVRLWTVRRYA